MVWADMDLGLFRYAKVVVGVYTQELAGYWVVAADMQIPHEVAFPYSTARKITFLSR